MKLSLRGHVDSLENTIGSIKCNEYNETYYFIKSDILGQYRNKIKKGDFVYFELKNNKNRRSKAYKITQDIDKDLELILKKNSSKINIGRLQNNAADLDLSTNVKANKHKEFKISARKKIYQKDISKIKIEFQEFITEHFIKLSITNKEINELVKLVVKDNLITETEKIFLKEKLKELKLPIKILDNIEKYMFSNNPFFDSILSIIFKDGIIKENELNFLYEKSQEHKFSKSFVNNRFWQYAVYFHLDDLLKDPNFLKIVKLWFYINHTKFHLGITKDWVIFNLNIFESNNLEINIERTLKVFENEVKKRMLLSDAELKELYNSFNSTKANTGVVADINELELNKEYSKTELYTIFDVNANSQGGKWNDGYCEHNDAWFIFANIDKSGKKDFDKEFNYDNSIDNFGDLNWAASKNSNLSEDSIEKLKRSSPYIFVSDVNTAENHWRYIGRGSCLYAIKAAPVKFKWKIIKTVNKRFSANIKNVDISESNSLIKLVKNIDVKEFNQSKYIVLETKTKNKYKELFNTNPFEAFNQFKKYAQTILKIKQNHKIKKIWNEEIITND